ncbi:MAG: sulfatase-like hydrolase/transferase [Terriglobales bacterium]
MRRPNSIVLILLAALVTTIHSAAQKRPVSAGKARSASSPNILLVTIDTLRADRLGCYGAKQVQTPTIDALARDGIVYERAMAQVPLTWPSHVAVLTGTYPFHNGVQDFTGQPLAPQFRTVAQSLRDHGYATAAVISSFVLDRSWGLARGFDHYDDAFAGADFLQKDIALVERRAGESVDRALGWLKERPRGKPFFLWLHLYDPHHPYDAPGPFRSQYRDRAYDGEVAYTDAEVGRLIAWLQRNRLYERTAVVLLSDHGESLGQHGEREHGFFIYNSTLHVPLLVKPAAGGRVAERRVSRPVETIAVAPTILQLAGIKDQIEQQFDSRSLLRPGQENAPVYSETFYPFSSFGWSPLRSLQSGDFHYIEAPKRELYNLRSDPAETNNIIAQQNAMAGVMSAKLRELMASASTQSQAQAGSVDPAAAEKLRSLGYFAYRSPVPASALDRLPDPKDKAAEFEWILLAADAFRAGNYKRGQELLQAAAQSDPQLYLIPFMLGEAALNQRDFAEAAAQLEKALELNHNFDQAMMALARALYAQGKHDGAREWLRHALKLNPQNFRAWYQLAWINSDHPEMAREELLKVLAIQPNFALARRDLGMLEFRRANYAQAATQLQNAADLGLSEPRLFNFLGISYSRLGRLQKAVKAYRCALALKPDLAEAHLNLGFAYQQLNKFTEARSEYQAACRLEQGLCSMIPKAD